jgi:hypothetical protein
MRKNSVLLIAFCIVEVFCMSNAEAQQRPYKMTTQIPPNLFTPDSVETRLGTLRFKAGYPDALTVQKVYDNLDFQRGVDVFLNAQSAPSLLMNLEGMRSIGIGGQTVGVFENLVDSKTLALTPNTQTVSLSGNIDLSNGPIVVEIPSNVLGLADDAWMRYIVDMGMVGPDKGQGGKFLFLPPGYQGKVPAGYHIARSRTFEVWLAIRGFTVDGDPSPAIAAFKKDFHIYPIAQASNPPATKFVNMSGKYLNSIQATDYTFFEQLDRIVQKEPVGSADPEILGQMAAIGIVKGKPFAPDARMKKILIEAAAVGNATARAIAFRPRDTNFYYYPGKSAWTQLFVGGDYQFLKDGATNLDARTAFYFTATGVTPAMAQAMVGQGSQYAVAAVDSKGAYLMGDKDYHLHLPTHIPAKTFWSVIVYDSQTRSLLQTDQQYPGISSEQGTVQSNPDGSVDVYFGPSAPTGREGNWIQTIPGKGWFAFLRLYGPEQSWFDKTWRPGEITTTN